MSILALVTNEIEVDDDMFHKRVKDRIGIDVNVVAMKHRCVR